MCRLLTFMKKDVAMTFDIGECEERNSLKEKVVAMTLPSANAKNIVISVFLASIVSCFLSFRFFLSHLRANSVALQEETTPLQSNFAQGLPPTLILSRPLSSAKTTPKPQLSATTIISSSLTSSNCSSSSSSTNNNNDIVYQFQPTKNYKQSPKIPQWMKSKN